jgi:hypothetical protein
MAAEIVAYADDYQLEVLFVTKQVREVADLNHNFVVRRKGITEASFPCVAVEILVHMLDHLDEFLARGLQPACPPTERNTALCMGQLWADFHIVEGLEGFTFYEDKQRLTFLASSVIRVLDAFWQRRKAQEKPED